MEPEPSGASTSDVDRAWSRFAGYQAVIFSTQEDTREIEALVAAAGLDRVATVKQIRPRPDPTTFLGRGRLEQARQLLTDHPHPLSSGGVPIVVLNGEVKPSVLFNVEDELKAEVWDRVRLILEIFRRNAKVKEARLQVELAQLRYELPFVHEALHRQLTGEHPGFMGGGELEARTYETHLRRRTKRLQADLARLTKERRMRRAGRRKTGLQLVAIAGYTNSGKSTLLNALTGSNVETMDQVFTTLQTTTRRLGERWIGRKATDLVFTDTVGFIEDLPPWLVDAFSSTLEEIGQADAVLLVADAHEDPATMEHKVRTALGVLERVHAPHRIIVCLNKADSAPPNLVQTHQDRLRAIPLPPHVPILPTSGKTGDGIPTLLEALATKVLEARETRVDLDVTLEDHIKFEHWLREHVEIMAQEDEGTTRRFHVRCGLPTWALLTAEAGRRGVTLTKLHSTGNKGEGVA